MIYIIIFFVLCYVIYKHIILPGFYWQRRGVYHVKPWGRFVRVFLSGKSLAESVLNAYKEFSGRRYVGSYQFMYPSLFISDLDMIKKITVKDFEYFSDRLGLSTQKNDPVFSLNLFSLKGEQWRDMRSTLSPAFTSSKMRSMFTLMSEQAERFTNYFLKKNEDVIEVETKNIFSKYTIDIIATCAFGVNSDSLENEKSEFFTMAMEVATFRVLQAIKGFFIIFCPKLASMLNISVIPQATTNFFLNLVRYTIALRERDGTVRPDMLHLLMEARKGRLKHENQTDSDAGFATVQESSIGKNESTKMELTDNVITAQVLIFFLAGFDTSSTTMSFMSHLLAFNPDVQQKLQKEIDEALAKCDGKICYEEILKMKYLDQVISETLRLFPAGYVLSRECVKNYEVPPETEEEKFLVIEKGCLITVPIIAIHRDAKYFPNPEKFDPERFNDENKSRIIPGSYMPFGCGPRNCIGSRFALLEIKALIVHLLSRFDIVPIKKTATQIVFAKSVNLGVKEGVWLGLKKREISA